MSPAIPYIIPMCWPMSVRWAGAIDAVFLPVNGVGNNMNMTDAADFAAAVGARAVVPLHIGLFDDLTADAFCCAGKVVPEFFKEIAL